MTAVAPNFVFGMGQSLWRGHQLPLWRKRRINERYAMVRQSKHIGCTACMDLVVKQTTFLKAFHVLEISVMNRQIPKSRIWFFRQSCHTVQTPLALVVLPTGHHLWSWNGYRRCAQDLCVGCNAVIYPYPRTFHSPSTPAADKCNYCRDTNLAADGNNTSVCQQSINLWRYEQSKLVGFRKWRKSVYLQNWN